MLDLAGHLDGIPGTTCQHSPWGEAAVKGFAALIKIGMFQPEPFTHAASVGGAQTKQNPHQCGFANAVRTNYPNPVTPPNQQIKVAKQLTRTAASLPPFFCEMGTEAHRSMPSSTIWPHHRPARFHAHGTLGDAARFGAFLTQGCKFAYAPLIAFAAGGNAFS